MGTGKAVGIGCLILAIIAVLGIGSCALGIIGKTVDTAKEMANQTVFNADKHVWSYEEFKHKYEAFQQHINLNAQAREEMAALKAEGVPRTDAEMRNLIMQKTGSSQMARNIAKEYNAMSRIAYQGIWKGQLPEFLEVPPGV